jgi:hypothetical protein
VADESTASAVEPVSEDYRALLDVVTQRFAEAQVRVARSLGLEVTRAYWQIGREISVRIRDQGWGASVIPRLSRDLRTRFPGARGFSVSNLR